MLLASYNQMKPILTNFLLEIGDNLTECKIFFAPAMEDPKEPTWPAGLGRGN
jgi:hypothetical protein